MQGEELKKAISAAVYIECSSKTQQVQILFVKMHVAKLALAFIVLPAKEIIIEKWEN